MDDNKILEIILKNTNDIPNIKANIDNLEKDMIEVKEDIKTIKANHLDHL
jgi:hypothetical protein